MFDSLKVAWKIVQMNIAAYVIKSPVFIRAENTTEIYNLQTENTLVIYFNLFPFIIC